MTREPRSLATSSKRRRVAAPHFSSSFVVMLPSTSKRAREVGSIETNRALSAKESLRATEARRHARHQPSLAAPPLPLIDHAYAAHFPSFGTLETFGTNDVTKASERSRAGERSSARVGVHKVQSGGRERWRAMLNKAHLGYFDDEDDAAEAYDRAHITMTGEAKNFDISKYDETSVARWRREDFTLADLLREQPPPSGHLPGKRPRSNHKGVTCDNRSKVIKYKVELFHQGRQVSLGYFDDLREAARAYDMGAIVSRGDKADINFPLADYEHDGTLERLRAYEGNFDAYRNSVVTRSRGPEKGEKTSKYRGVRRFMHQHADGTVTVKWRAELVVRHKRHDLGYHRTEDEAARAVDLARCDNPPVAVKFLNFPEEFEHRIPVAERVTLARSRIPPYTV